MALQIKCIHCGRLAPANPRNKNQRYCSDQSCQRVRKAKWQRAKMASDPDYRANQRAAQQKWVKSNKNYWRRYRADNPRYQMRNLVLQRKRDFERRERELAKMDASNYPLNQEIRLYYAVPDLAKMDASRAKYLLIPAC